MEKIPITAEGASQLQEELKEFEERRAAGRN